MDFFFVKDWLNRPEPYAFKLDHILFIIIGLLIGVLLCFLLHKKDKKTVKIVLIVLWGIVIVTQVVYYSIHYTMAVVDPVNHPFEIRKMLPLHSCLMYMYVMPFALFSKNRVVKTAANNFLVVVNMIMGFITLFVGCPSKGYSALSFNGFQSLLYHVIIVITPLIMVTTGYYDIKIGDVKYGLGLFLILATLIWIFDYIAGCDYFYIFDGTTFGVLEIISENVPPIVWTLITVSCYLITGVAMHFLVIGIKYYFAKRHASEEEISSQE